MEAGDRKQEARSMNILLLIIVIIICLFLEGFFSGSELALVVADRLRLKNRADQGDVKSKLTLKMIGNPGRLFSTTLLGTNVCVVTASTVLTYYIISNFGDEYSAFALLLSPVVLIFGEVLPKSIYQHHADVLARRVGTLLFWISYILFPLTWLLSGFTKLLLGGVEYAASSEPRISRDELALMLSSREAKDSDMPPEERKMIKRVLNLSDAEVENIMIPIVEVEMLPVGADTDAALSVFDLKGFSRLPLFEHRSHNIVGIIDAADCIFASERKNLKDIMKGVIYVPETMPIYELYETLQEAREEVAVVVDEYGGATGLVTLEDILEEVVGEIRDEYELGEQHFRILSDGKFLVSGRMEVEEANEKLKLGVPEGDYETVAGYVLELFGYIPESGESITTGNWRYTIKNATDRAVVEIEVVRVD